MVVTDVRLPEHTVVSDASGCWECGETCGRELFQVQWAGLGYTQEYGIMAKDAADSGGSSGVGPEMGRQLGCDNWATVNTG